MLDNLDRKLRRWVAMRVGNRIPWLYSTVDKPEKIPVQVKAYELVEQKYLRPDDSVLDVGFGLGYGLRILSRKARRLAGIEIDKKAVAYARTKLSDLPVEADLRRYDGRVVPFGANAFDVVTCVDVIEHVPDYMGLIREMVRVSRRIVLVSTPNRRPENTRPDGKPKNFWHLREWSYDELDEILQQVPDVQVEWDFLDGPWEGPFEVGSEVSIDTLALAPALLIPPTQE